MDNSQSFPWTQREPNIVAGGAGYNYFPAGVVFKLLKKPNAPRTIQDTSKYATSHQKTQDKGST
eukprot:12103522-Prorocentrum_lima.AAC.1